MVPNQKPEDVLINLRKFLDDGGFEDIEITYLGGEPAARTDPDDPFVNLVVAAAEPVYGMPMQIAPMIGSVIASMTRTTRNMVPTVAAEIP